MSEALTNQELIEVLEARSGMVCLVGAGGKKTTLYRLASIHPGRIGVTSTVAIPPFPETLEAYKVIAQEGVLLARIVEATAHARVVAFAKPSIKHGRLGGLEPAEIATIQAALTFDVILVKADGARSRRIKSPGLEEPKIPKEATTVIPVVSAHAIGEPLSERIAHRVDRLASVLNIRPGDSLTANHIAQLLASDQGMLKGVGKARVVPLINRVDNPAIKQAAWKAAEQALALSSRFDRVVLACMRHPNPLVGVVWR